MTSRPFIRLLLVALALACSGLPARAAAPTAGATAKPAPGKSGPAKPGDPPAVDPFETVRVKIDQLLKARINPEPLPAVLPNPFTLPNAAVAPTGDDDLAPAEVPVPAAAAAEGPEPGGDKAWFSSTARRVFISTGCSTARAMSCSWTNATPRAPSKSCASRPARSPSGSTPRPT